MDLFKFEITVEVEGEDIIDAEDRLDDAMNEIDDVVITWQYNSPIGG